MHHFFLNWDLYCAWKKFKTWYAWVFCIFMTWSKLLVHAICLYNGLFWCFCIDILYANEWASASFFYRRDHFKSWGGTLSVSTPPYSPLCSDNFDTYCGGWHLRWVQVAPPWRFLNFHLEHPLIKWNHPNLPKKNQTVFFINFKNLGVF